MCSSLAIGLTFVVIWLALTLTRVTGMLYPRCRPSRWVLLAFATLLTVTAALSVFDTTLVELALRCVAGAQQAATTVIGTAAAPTAGVIGGAPRLGAPVILPRVGPSVAERLSAGIENVLAIGVLAGVGVLVWKQLLRHHFRPGR